MTVAVLCKWCADPADIEIRADGTISTERARSEVSEYDRVAIELAAALATAEQCRLVLLTAGGQDIDTSLALKSLLSRGPGGTCG